MQQYLRKLDTWHEADTLKSILSAIIFVIAVDIFSNIKKYHAKLYSTRALEFPISEIIDLQSSFSYVKKAQLEGQGWKHRLNPTLNVLGQILS